MPTSVNGYQLTYSQGPPQGGGVPSTPSYSHRGFPGHKPHPQRVPFTQISTPEGSLDTNHTPRGSLDTDHTPRGFEVPWTQITPQEGSLDTNHTPRGFPGHQHTPEGSSGHQHTQCLTRYKPSLHCSQRQRNGYHI